MERTHYGVHAELEAVADEILRQQVAKLPRSEKMDILTAWKERDRYSREVYNKEGFPDPAVRRGMFNRSWNPQHGHLNSRDGQTPGYRMEEAHCYVPNNGYDDRAGKVYSGRMRPQSACRVIRWGPHSRLQCVMCIRYIPWGDETTCSGCQTIYVKDEVLYV